jgi:hypothetical protein
MYENLEAILELLKNPNLPPNTTDPSSESNGSCSIHALSQAAGITSPNIIDLILDEVNGPNGPSHLASPTLTIPTFKSHLEWLIKDQGFPPSITSSFFETLFSAAASALSTSIRIFNENRDRTFSPLSLPSATTLNPIHLYHSNQHYYIMDSVEPTSSSKGKLPPGYDFVGGSSEGGEKRTIFPGEEEGGQGGGGKRR